MKFSIKDFFSKCDQIRSFLRIWSHLLKKSLDLNFVQSSMASKARSSVEDLTAFLKEILDWDFWSKWTLKIFKNLVCRDQ